MGILTSIFTGAISNLASDGVKKIFNVTVSKDAPDDKTISVSIGNGYLTKDTIERDGTTLRKMLVHEPDANSDVDWWTYWIDEAHIHPDEENHFLTIKFDRQRKIGLKCRQHKDKKYVYPEELVKMYLRKGES